MLHNRYRLTGQLGAGAFGTVLKGADALLADKPVAIKRVESQVDISAEMAFLAQLDHPNIPPVQDYFQDHGCFYLVMKYIEGQTLADKMAAGQPVPLDEVLKIGLTLCNVLDYLHVQNPPVIFRDLKPENVIITPAGHLYLIDFGIARTFKPGQSKDTYALGSNGYAPPEQYDRTQTTPRSDIYALGALLYYLLTADDPSAHVFRFEHMRITDDPIRHVIEVCTRLDADKRYDSAREVGQRLHLCQQVGSSALPRAGAPPKPNAQATLAPPMAVLPSVQQAVPTTILPAQAMIGRSIIWVYTKEDEKIVKSLETHLAAVRRKYNLTFLHNHREASAGTHIKRYWCKIIAESFIVAPISSPYFWSDDDLVRVWESLIYPEAKLRGRRVLPVIGRAVLGGDPADLFKEMWMPRSGNPLGGDSDYAECANAIKGLCESEFVV
jgi:serine/threonine protein kinase